MSSFEDSARTLKILGHPLRLKIAAMVHAQAKCVRDICGCLGLPQAVISQHLALLKKRGIIEGKRHGVEMHYSVVNPLAKVIFESIKQR
jgi:ArsR family transcriptional regulator